MSTPVRILKKLMKGGKGHSLGKTCNWKVKESHLNSDSDEELSDEMKQMACPCQLTCRVRPSASFRKALPWTKTDDLRLSVKFFKDHLRSAGRWASTPNHRLHQRRLWRCITGWPTALHYLEQYGKRGREETVVSEVSFNDSKFATALDKPKPDVSSPDNLQCGNNGKVFVGSRIQLHTVYVLEGSRLFRSHLFPRS